MAPDYKSNDPQGWCGDPKRGAALGRPTVKDAPKDFAGKLHLRRVHLGSGGYDSNGTYFGIGQPLWWVAADSETPGVFGYSIDFMLRAPNRESAKTTIRVLHYPNARFYR